MQDLDPARRRDLDELARRYGVRIETVQALFDALAAGGGSMAQFDIPELGGMGQWSEGGMTMVGDVFDTGLKARVAALCSDLAPLVRGGPAPGHEAAHAPASAHAGSARPAPPAEAARPSFGRAQSQLQGAGQPAGPPGGGQWWPAELGTPASSGAQNGVRYAYFPDARRLAVQRDGRLSLYDTGEHRIAGVSQQPGGTRSLAFTGQHGPVSLDSLPPVGPGEARPAPSAPPAPAHSAPAPARTAAGPTDDPLTTIERLAELRQKGVLTEEEFAAAKSELLRRL